MSTSIEKRQKKTDWTREDDEVKEEDKRERKRLNTMSEIVSI